MSLTISKLTATLSLFVADISAEARNHLELYKHYQKEKQIEKAEYHKGMAEGLTKALSYYLENMDKAGLT